MLKKTTLHVQGMHCPSCEILVTDKFKEVGGVKNVKANFRNCEAEVTYSGDLNLNKLNRKIENFGYKVVHGPIQEEIQEPLLSRLMDVSIISLVLLFVYFIAQKLDLIPTIGGSAGLTVITAVLLGLVASVSTCMATSGALFLSTIGTLTTNSKELIVDSRWSTHKLIPAISFSLGRIISYAVVGFIAGYVGNTLTNNLQLGALLTLVVSIFMILVGLDMAKIISLQKYMAQTFSKGIFEKLSGKLRENPRRTALFLGMVTVLLPCGFTQTVLVYSIGLADPVQSMLMMAAFAVGTVPTLIVIGFVNSFTTSSWYPILQKIMGVVVLFIGVTYVMNFLSLAGVSFPNLAVPSARQQEVTNEPVVKNGVQEIVMTVDGRGYSPSFFKVKKGVPVRWIIKGENVYGCQGYLVAPRMNVQQALKPGDNVIEFTPTENGTLPFSCGMGMYRGQFQVE
ncbi:MAG: sulfite exporter TauE/SafE family protein [Patescibacteria group bacterium]|jgi:sulfite exporter TauE/SafE/copper chaperone CopZ